MCALHLFLLLGALIGLLGQEAAFASGPPAVSAPMAVSSMADSGMSEDCMKMMAQQPQPAQKPCKGMTLACIAAMRSEEHTSELQSLMRISYAVFCLKKKKTYKHEKHTRTTQHEHKV